jgi:hypothetical protein
MSGQQRSRRWRWWATGFVALVVVVIFGMLKTRDWAIKRLSTPESIDEWQQWRDDVQQQQSQGGPVRRRAPTSDEPPALILMRDHFAASLAGAVLFCAALYWVIAWFVSGVMNHRRPTPDT